MLLARVQWRAAAVVLLGAALQWAGAPPTAGACFGTRLRVGVPTTPHHALAGFATGYYVEEKTGIAPEFVELSAPAAQALTDGDIDLVITTDTAAAPDGVEVRPAGMVPGLGSASFWIHPEVLDDLRFFTVERALSRATRLFTSAAYGEAVQSTEPPRKAARQAVLHAD
jgi:hypothetical protein